MTRKEIVALINKFVVGFNEYNLDLIISMFAEDATTTDHFGNVATGRVQIREQLEPYFDRSKWVDRFESLREDVDLESNTAWSLWKLIRTTGSEVTEIRGCDTFQFEDGLIKRQAVFGQKSMFP